MAAREVTVTDNLLKTMIGIKYESGVDPDKIKKILDFYDFPPEKEKPKWRETCLAELTALQPSENAPAARTLSASDIWPSRIFDEGSSQEFGTYVPTAHSALIEGVGANYTATSTEAQERVSEDRVNEAANRAPGEEAGLDSTADPAYREQAVFSVEKIHPEPAIDDAKRDVGDKVESSVAPSSSREKGNVTMWGKLTPLDIERAVGDLSLRRQEIMARHAQELEELDAEERQIAALKQAIGAFAAKFTLCVGHVAGRNDASEECDLKLVS